MLNITGDSCKGFKEELTVRNIDLAESRSRNNLDDTRRSKFYTERPVSAERKLIHKSGSWLTTAKSN